MTLPKYRCQKHADFSNVDGYVQSMQDIMNAARRHHQTRINLSRHNTHHNVNMNLTSKAYTDWAQGHCHYTNYPEPPLNTIFKKSRFLPYHQQFAPVDTMPVRRTSSKSYKIRFLPYDRSIGNWTWIVSPHT